MSEPRWTRGPWVAARPSIGATIPGLDLNRREVYGIDRRRRSICRLNEFLDNWTEEDEANLNLILAAPALYEALAAVMRAHDTEEWPAARAALAKAKGETG